MRIAVLGAGRMGRIVDWDMRRQDDVEFTAAYDASVKNLTLLKESGSKSHTRVVDLANDDIASFLMKDEIDVAIACAGYSLNVRLIAECIKAGVSMVDLGGNVGVVQEQKLMDVVARQNNVTIVPDCGLAPGMASMLGMLGYKAFDDTEMISMRVGGLPRDPGSGPLGYNTTWSVNGLINEYVEPCIAVRYGEMVQEEPLEGLETLTWFDRESLEFKEFEAFNTSGGASNLPTILKGKVQHLDYKTIRYPGHCAVIKGMKDIGFFSERPVGSVVPRLLTEQLFEEAWKGTDDDIVMLRVTTAGRTGCMTYELMEFAQDGMTAMARTTALSAATVAHMIGAGDVTVTGVVNAETSVPLEGYLAGIRSRGLTVIEARTAGA